MLLSLWFCLCTYCKTFSIFNLSIELRLLNIFLSHNPKLHGGGQLLLPRFLILPLALQWVLKYTVPLYQSRNVQDLKSNPNINFIHGLRNFHHYDQKFPIIILSVLKCLVQCFMLQQKNKVHRKVLIHKNTDNCSQSIVKLKGWAAGLGHR